MGYSTCVKHRKRTCDICDKCLRCEEERTLDSGRMHVDECPAGWCPPTHLCPTCRVKHKDKITHWHDKCAGYVAQVREQQQTQEAAERAGLAVIKAGVSLPGGERVYAWTTQGNYEVLSNIYHAGLNRIDHVLDLSGAVRRYDDSPAEVYHTTA